MTTSTHKQNATPLRQRTVFGLGVDWLITRFLVVALLTVMAVPLALASGNRVDLADTTWAAATQPAAPSAPSDCQHADAMSPDHNCSA